MRVSDAAARTTCAPRPRVTAFCVTDPLGIASCAMLDGIQLQCFSPRAAEQQQQSSGDDDGGGDSRGSSSSNSGGLLAGRLASACRRRCCSARRSAPRCLVHRTRQSTPCGPGSGRTPSPPMPRLATSEAWRRARDGLPPSSTFLAAAVVAERGVGAEGVRRLSRSPRRAAAVACCVVCASGMRIGLSKAVARPCHVHYLG